MRVNEPHDIVELRDEITIWNRAASSIITLTADENVIRDIISKKIDLLQQQLQENTSLSLISTEMYEQTLHNLVKKVSTVCHYIFIQENSIEIYVLKFICTVFIYVWSKCIEWVNLYNNKMFIKQLFSNKYLFSLIPKYIDIYASIIQSNR